MKRYVVAGLLGLAVSCATAQTSYHVSSSKIITGSWTMTPIYARTNGVPGAIHSFQALADTSALESENLVAVWYVHEGAKWYTLSWDTTDPWTAIKSVTALLDISDSADAGWWVESAKNSPAQAPEAYASGVLADDPLAFLVESSPNRNKIVELLTSIGYPAANVPVEVDDDCAVNDRLDGLAAEARAMIANGDDTVLSLSTAAMCNVAGTTPVGPEPTQPPKPVTAPPWSPPGTVPASPAWTPGGWPPGPAIPPALPGPAWGCTSTSTLGGGNSCSCARTQQWGQWQSTTCWGFTCIKWHRVKETETCTDLMVACPPGGPPASQASCTTRVTD